MARYLVTGGAGFIGSSIAAALLARGDAVVILDDFSSGRRENLERLQGLVEVIEGDLCDPAIIEHACRGVTGIFHQAAIASVARSIEDPLRCDEVNVHGTVRLLETARRNGISRFVLAASAAAYGNTGAAVQREDAIPDPISPYAVSKVTGEYYVRVFAQLYAMKTISLRYFNVFGPYQDPKSDYAAAIPIFIRALLDGRRPTVFGDGEQTRDFCYIDNVVNVNLAAIASDAAAGQVINVGCGASTSINSLIATLQGIIGTRVAPHHAPARPGDVRHSRAGIERAASLLAYAPQVTVAEGLARTVEYYRKIPS